MKCVSCGQELEDTIKTRGKFCFKCMHKITLKVDWRTHKRTLTRPNITPELKKRIEKKIKNINEELLYKFGIDMEKDRIK